MLLGAARKNDLVSQHRVRRREPLSPSCATSCFHTIGDTVVSMSVPIEARDLPLGSSPHQNEAYDLDEIPWRGENGCVALSGALTSLPR